MGTIKGTIRSGLIVAAAAFLVRADCAWAIDFKPQKIRDSLETVTEQAKKETSAPPVETIARPAVRYQAQELKDPFKEPQQQEKGTGGGGSAVTLPALKVQGIIWGTSIPQAIINNTVVRIGDVLPGGVRIVTITKDSVTVFFQSRNYTLSSPVAEQLESLQKKGGQNEK